MGLFDTNYDGNWGCEDNDLGFRLCEKGIKIKLCRAAESVHYPHGKDMNIKLQQGYENCVYFNRKFATIATQIFLDNYRKLVLNESVDINELLLIQTHLF